MNRYVATYYTKAGRIVVSPEFETNLSLKEFIEHTVKLIKREITITMEIKGEYEVILTNNIESFKVTQY